MMFAVAALNGAMDNAPRCGEVTDGELVRLLTHPLGHAGEKVDAPAWSPVKLRLDEQGRHRRAARYVESVSCLVMDFDRGEPLKRAKPLIEGRRAILHTSWSHTREKPKGRLVFPLAEPAPASRWADVWLAAEAWAKTASLTMDPAAKDASRLYFLPAYPESEPRRRYDFWARAWQGDYLSWRWLVMAYAPPKPRAFAPVPSVAVRGLPGQDRSEQRRHFARRVIETRAQELATAAEGGRNLLAFRAGAAAGRLRLAGVLDLEEARATLISAAMASGLTPREAEHAVANGIQRGEADGPWSF
jgi:hypothetical protein